MGASRACAVEIKRKIDRDSKCSKCLIHTKTQPDPRRTSTDSREGRDSNDSQKPALGAGSQNFFLSLLACTPARRPTAHRLCCLLKRHISVVLLVSTATPRGAQGAGRCATGAQAALAGRTRALPSGGRGVRAVGTRCGSTRARGRLNPPSTRAARRWGCEPLRRAPRR